ETHRGAHDTTGARVTRAATGGIAIGAMLAIVGFQLTAHLRQKDDDRRELPAPVAFVSQRSEAEPVAWLSDSPKTLKSPEPRGSAKAPDHGSSPRPRETSSEGMARTRSADGGVPSRDAGRAGSRP
ncbi:MAG TPA: hypothetical protein VF395_22665, partial [Polyangiaceae bacterium]